LSTRLIARLVTRLLQDFSWFVRSPLGAAALPPESEDTHDRCSGRLLFTHPSPLHISPRGRRSVGRYPDFWSTISLAARTQKNDRQLWAVGQTALQVTTRAKVRPPLSPADTSSASTPARSAWRRAARQGLDSADTFLSLW